MAAHSAKKMNQYFRNLWLALWGENPFGVELDEVKSKCEYAEGQLTALTAMHRDVENKMRELQTASEESVRVHVQQMSGMRKLLSEKDDVIGELRNAAKERSDRYAMAIETLRAQQTARISELESEKNDLREDRDAALEQLQKVQQDLGREMTNTNTLNKTNNAISDLLQAVQSRDAEKMKMAADYLSWHEGLAGIAHNITDIIMNGNTGISHTGSRPV